MYNNKTLLIIGLFAVALVVFTLFTTKIMFPDTAQYVGFAKEFSGDSTSKVRNLPSPVYPLFLGQFLKIAPNIVTIKIINILWLLGIGLLLFHMTKNYKALLLWIFSPLVWYMAPWLNPIMAVAFFVLLAYHLFIEYEKKNDVRYLILSGLSMGATGAIWWAATYVMLFFTFAFFFDKKFKDVIIFLIAALFTYSIKLLIEYIIYGFPILSIIRSIGSNFSQGVQHFPPLSHYLIGIISIIFLVSVFFYKIEFRKYKKETMFLALSIFLFLLNFQFRYYIIVLPLILFLISKNINKKHLIIHIFLAFFVVIYFTSGIFGQIQQFKYDYFGETEDYKIMQDLNDIGKDFPNERFIVGSSLEQEEQAFTLSTLYWGDSIREFIWFSDYYLSLQGKSDLKQYTIHSNPRINDIRKISFNIVYSRTDIEDYGNVKYAILIGEGSLERFELVEEYRILKVLKRV